MDRRLKRSAIVSALAHGAVIALLVVALPTERLNAPESVAVDVQIIGPYVPQQALHKGKVAAPADTRTVSKAHLATAKPAPKPIEAPPPPPPPPPPAPQKPMPKLPAPPKPPPPPTPAPSLPMPPAPAPTPKPALKLPTPPKPAPTPPKPAPKLPKPPAPAPAPPKPQPQPKPKPEKTLPPPPKPAPPKPEQKTPTTQKHQVKTPVPMSKTVQNTLAKLRALEKQTHPPKHKYNPKQGGAPNGGGTRMSTANSHLTAADRSAIANAVRPCWGIDAGAPGVSDFSVLLQVTTDAQGTVREAQVAPADQGRLSNPVFAAFAQRAVDAVKNYQCAKLPLPSYMLGAPHQFTFRFSP